jgi:hypothetical protein
MGCDIHLYVEKKNLDGTWRRADSEQDCIYDSRNYQLFALLAGVRNRYNLEPISQPRGLPEDCCPEIATEREEYGGHSSSYLSLSEILRYDFTKIRNESGVLSWDTWREWYEDYGDKRYKNRPRGWSSGAFGAMVKYITEEEAIALGSKASHHYPDKSLYLKCEWEVPLYEMIREFLSETLPKLLKISDGDYENTRIVFWFDN